MQKAPDQTCWLFFRESMEATNIQLLFWVQGRGVKMCNLVSYQQRMPVNSTG